MFIKAKYIFTGFELLENHSLKIEDGIFTKIYSEEEISKNNFSKIIDYGNTLILPGFVNSHCHLELTGVGVIKPQSLQAKNTEEFFVKWIQALVTKKNTLTEEQKEHGIKQGIHDLISSGVTTLGDHISFNTDYNPILDSPLKGRLFFEVIGVLPEVCQDIYRFLKEGLPKDKFLKDFYFNIVPHSVHALFPDILKEIFQDEDHPLSCHLAESLAEKRYFEEKSGEMMKLIQSIGIKHCHPAESGYQFLKQENINIEKTLIIHGNDLSSSELIDIAHQDMSIVHCPHSHEYFNHSPLNIDEILNKKINLALGTDSLASNYELNFLKEIQTFKKKNPQIDDTETLKMATINGAKALKLDHVTGSIEIGKQADFIGIKLDKQMKNPLSIVFEKNKIDHVFINGEEISCS